MSADLLRRAAALMRERAEATVRPKANPWFDTAAAFMQSGFDPEDGEFISSMSPAVALAVAKAMDDVAQAWEISDGWAMDLDDGLIPFEDTVDGGWLDVARVYLGEQA